MRKGVVKAVDDVSFTLNRGELIGVVGESGCGKSITVLSIMRLISPPGKIVDGEIVLNGKDILKVPLAQMPNIRGNEVSMIFQEPMTSLNPVFTIGRQISETFKSHQNLRKRKPLKSPLGC